MKVNSLLVLGPSKRVIHPFKLNVDYRPQIGVLWAVSDAPDRRQGLVFLVKKML